MNVTILNIGLGPSVARPQGTALGEALDAAMRVFLGAYVEFRTIQGSEPVLVLVVTHTIDVQAVFRLSERIGQDCIALIGPGFPQGALLGPEAARYGAFDHSLFVLPKRFITF